jgi:plastocyanin
MKTVFADTYYFLAIGNERDEGYSRSVEFAESYTGQILTTEWVLTEVGDALSALQQRPDFLNLISLIQRDANWTVKNASCKLHRLVRIVLCLGVGLCGGSAAADDSVASAVAADCGTIEGVVTYRSDAKKPWRYARFYVKNAKSGELAEAIVAIRGKGLKNAAAPAPGTAVIDQKDFAFQPELVAIRVGDSVTFTNGDAATHNVRASGEVANFNVTIAAGGAGRTIKFDKAGGVRRPVEIGCVFHSNMKAWVFVFDHPFYAVTKADGKFTLEDVPPGEYELEVAHPAGGLKSRKNVKVKAGETVKMNVEMPPADLR